jgi:hypothetical protein
MSAHHGAPISDTRSSHIEIGSSHASAACASVIRSHQGQSVAIRARTIEIGSSRLSAACASGMVSVAS